MKHSIPTKRTILTRRRGSALVTVLIATIVLVTMGTALIAASTGRMRLTSHRQDTEHALQLAELGLQHGLAKLQQNVNYSGQGNTLTNTGYFRVEFPTPPPGQPSNLVPMIGVGRVLSLGGQYIERRVRGTVDVKAVDEIWKYAVITKSNQQFYGNFSVGSIDIKGNIHANGSITLDGNPVINGRVTTTGSIVRSGGPTITDGSKQGIPPKPFPIVDVAAFRTQSVSNGVYIGDKVIDTGSKQGNTPGVITLKGQINGNLSISGNVRVILDGPVHVTGNVNIDGNTVLGNGMLLADGKIRVAGNNGTVAVDAQLADNNLALVSLNNAEDAIVVQGSAGITGGLYAPNGRIHIDGDANILGTLAADRLYSSGNGLVRTNTSYKPPPMFPPRPKLVSWREL